MLICAELTPYIETCFEVNLKSKTVRVVGPKADNISMDWAGLLQHAHYLNQESTHNFRHKPDEIQFATQVRSPQILVQ